MPARPFWVIFTICIIILVEWLIVPRVIETVVTKDLPSLGVTLQDVKPVFDDTSLKIPNSLRTQFVTDPDNVLSADDLKGVGFKSKLAILLFFEQTKAITYVAGLFLAGILAGFLFASVAFRQLVKFGDRLGELSGTDKIAILMGVILGLLLTGILVPALMSWFNMKGNNPGFRAIFAVIIISLCVKALTSMKDELKFYFPGLSTKDQMDKAFQKPKILDTNVIIDGRIADVCRSGFLEGKICIPSFVLEELQHIADSADGLRRARGRRGLDILNVMRTELNLQVTQSESVDPADSEEVDVKLVKLAKEIEGAIVTNDFNLNKVAQLQGVTVLNINELANALKPVVLPGEELTVSVIKEGKEAGQGVAYLDDGTMIVVEGARSHVGDTVDAIVTSVLQTVAGKMIFANLKAVQDQEDELIGRNVRSYSSFRPRKKVK